MEALHPVDIQGHLQVENIYSRTTYSVYDDDYLMNESRRKPGRDALLFLTGRTESISRCMNPMVLYVEGIVNAKHNQRQLRTLKKANTNTKSQPTFANQICKSILQQLCTNFAQI